MCYGRAHIDRVSVQVVSNSRRVAHAERLLPRFFFNVSNSIQITDEVGTVLGNIAEARAHAVVAANDLLRLDGDVFWAGNDWHMQVKDEADNLVCTLRFSAETFPED